MYRWVEHTGELELEIESRDEPAVFAEAVRAFGELLAEGDGPDGGADARARPPQAAASTRAVEVEAPNRPTLLVEFCTELAFLAESEGFVPEALERVVRDGDALRATVRGRIGDPPHLVKAVTYHGLSFDAVEGGWRARVVLDV